MSEHDKEDPGVQVGEYTFAQSLSYRLIRNAGSGTKPLVLALHGMGQDAATLLKQLGPLRDGSRHLLVPDGPLPYEVRTESPPRIGHAWYLYTGDQAAFLASARRSAAVLLDLVDRLRDEQSLTGPLILLGYSQGGYLAGAMALEAPDRYAALISLASRIKHELWPSDRPAPQLPVFCSHGARDRHVKPEASRSSADVLRHAGFAVDWHEHAAGHRLSTESIEAAAEWMKARGL